MLWWCFNVKGKMYILLRHAVAFLHAAYSTVPFFWIACMDRIVLRFLFCVSLAGRCKIGGFQYGHSQLCEGQPKNTELISHLEVDKSRPGFTVKVLAPACGLPGQPLERRCHVLRRKGLCANSRWQRARLWGLFAAQNASKGNVLNTGSKLAAAQTLETWKRIKSTSQHLSKHSKGYIQDAWQSWHIFGCLSRPVRLSML